MQSCHTPHATLLSSSVFSGSSSPTPHLSLDFKGRVRLLCPPDSTGHRLSPPNSDPMGSSLCKVEEMKHPRPSPAWRQQKGNVQHIDNCFQRNLLTFSQGALRQVPNQLIHPSTGGGRILFTVFAWHTGNLVPFPLERGWTWHLLFCSRPLGFLVKLTAESHFSK